MPSAAIFRLLLTAPSADEANHFVSILRSANYTVDAKLATQEHELQPLLAQHWDLVLALESHSLLTPARVKQNLLRTQNSAPLIIISELADQHSLLDGLRLGAETVVARDHDQHLLLAVERSQQSAQVTRQLNSSNAQLQILQRQQRSLLNNWPTPLIVAVEGIIRLCNSAAIRLLQSEASALLDMPILDSLDSRSRQLLRPQLLAEQPQTAASPELLTFVNRKGDSSTRRVTVKPILFDDHSALLITVEARLRGDESNARARRSELPSQPQQVAAAIERGIQRQRETGRTGALMQIVIAPAATEQLSQHQCSTLLDQLINLSSTTIGEASELLACSAEAFILTLIDCDSDYALARAQLLHSELNKAALIPRGRQGGTEVNVGVTLLDASTADSQQALQRCRQANLESADRSCAALYPDGSTADREVFVDALIEQGRLAVHYQPLRALCAPVRSLHMAQPRGGVDNPELTALLEQVHSGGQRQRLDHWLIVSALHELVSTIEDVELLLPISAESATDSRFVPWLQTQLRNYPLSGNTLTLVLRESDVIRHLEKVASSAAQLEQLAIGLAISHFGVALNPLETLNSIEPRLLLLDRQISAELGATSDQPSSAGELLESLIDLNQQVVVVGVENAKPLPQLWRAGVHYIGGSYVGSATVSARR